MSTPVGIEGRFGADCVGTASADHVESISSSYFLATAPKKLRGDVYANEIERVQLDEPGNLAASVCVCVCVMDLFLLKWQPRQTTSDTV